MTTATLIKGNKGGGSSPRTPVEQPDDLQSVAKAKLLLALGEGEFAGGLDGKSIFLDGTPLENADGSQNFSGVAWEFRPGAQAQTYIQGMPGTENEISVGTTVSSATAWTHTFTNGQLSAIRLRLKWPSLFNQQDNGDLVGYSISYTIDLQTDGGAWQTVVNTAVTGKTTSGYERSHRIDLPQSGSTWTVRLRKVTADANSAKIGDTMTLQSYTEVIDAKLRYPNTALLYIEFDSSQFNGSIPQVSCEPMMRIVRVPDNYDPITRTYSGTWTGSFKWAWTNNPTWIFYDIVISDRFGLGQRLTAANIDKWTLYQVAQYCDQMVPDGKGGSGTEPRYTCDVYVQDRNDAYTVLRDFAAIFRGMTYWGGNQIVALADMPRDIDYSYTRANVLNGEFNYSSSTTKTRYTTALVSWSDPANAYADAMEPVFEQSLVARYGFNQLELTAIGCTRQSEANRKGRWGILTNNKDRVVSFSVGLDGMIPQPGYIIAVADEMLSGKVTGGRISAVNGRVVTLDRKPDIAAGGRLILNLPSGASQARTIQAVNDQVITVTTAYSEVPQVESVWVVESDELYAQQYRVVSVSDNNDGTFTISGAYYDPDKYARIDTGALIDDRPISVIPPGNQTAPANIVISSFSVVQQGISVETMRCSWDQAPNAISYETQWRRNDGNWVNVPRNSTTSFDVPGIYAGRYLVRVRAINAAEISSGWGYSEEKTLTGKVGNPPKPVGFMATPINWGIRLNWGFPDNTADTLKTEIQCTPNTDQSNPLLLTDVPYPHAEYLQLGLKAGQTFWYRAQLVDKTGNESGWTDWIQGESNADAGDYLDAIRDDVLTSEDGKQLTDKIDFGLQAQLEAALKEGEMVRQQNRQHGQARAQIAEIWKVRADDNEAFAQYQLQVAASFGEQQAAIDQKMTGTVTATSAEAIYTLRTGVMWNGQYYDAGLSVATMADGTGVKSRIAINADQFVMLSGQGSVQYSPFSVSGGQVFIADGMIKEASIGIGKISESLQSRNYSASAGWYIDKTGIAIFNQVTVRGIVYASAGVFTGTIYATDGKFSGTVEAKNFIGDIANGGVFPVPPRVSGVPAVTSLTYTDSGGASQAKNITVYVTVTGTTPGSTIPVNITIGGVTRSLGVFGDSRASASGMCHFTVEGVTANQVGMSVSSGGSGYVIDRLDATVIVTRGSGSFV
jgi:predicted phage tail protein